MSETFVTYNLARYRIGDSWPGLVMDSITVDSDPPDFTLTGVEMKFRQDSRDGEVKETLSVGSGITIDSAANWGFTVAKQVLSGLDTEGVAYWDIKLTDSNGDIYTYIEGQMSVVSDI